LRRRTPVFSLVAGGVSTPINAFDRLRFVMLERSHFIGIIRLEAKAWHREQSSAEKVFREKLEKRSA
jgi:hypothetical protein